MSSFLGEIAAYVALRAMLIAVAIVLVPLVGIGVLVGWLIWG